MISISRSCLLLLVFFCIISAAIVNAAETTTRGKISGGDSHSFPDWFKQSFLEIGEDVKEATAEGKHLMLFFDLDGCPYCGRMLQESFMTDPLSSYIQSNFDVIAVNIQGDLDIEFNEEISVTESRLAEILKVHATPALVFLNENNETIARVDGYRAPERFQQVLEYVATRSYLSTSLPDYLAAKLDRNVYQLRENPQFSDISDLSSVEGPLMLIFEDGSCYDCDEFHDEILTDERVQGELPPFTMVRLDTDSNDMILDFDGNKSTPAELAGKFGTIYRPGILLLEDGELLRHHNRLNYPQHLMESLRYVGRGHHKESDYRSYQLQFREELLKSGVDIDWGRSRKSE